MDVRRAVSKAIKTIFLCHHFHSEALRREIHKGLNVTEQWNAANDFVFFARRGELVSNHREDHEASMLALHLLQNGSLGIAVKTKPGSTPLPMFSTT